jgi:hypothetical protein
MVALVHREFVRFFLSKALQSYLAEKHVKLEVCWPGHCGNLCTREVVRLKDECVKYACEECYVATLALTPAPSTFWTASSINREDIPSCKFHPRSFDHKVSATQEVKCRQWQECVCDKCAGELTSAISRPWPRIGQGVENPEKAFPDLALHKKLELLLRGFAFRYCTTSRLVGFAVLWAISWIVGASVASVWEQRVGFAADINHGFQLLVVFLVTSAVVQTVGVALVKVVQCFQSGGGRGIRVFGLIDVAMLATFAPLLLAAALLAALLFAVIYQVSRRWRFPHNLAVTFGVAMGSAVAGIWALLYALVCTVKSLCDPGLLSIIVSGGWFGRHLKSWWAQSENRVGMQQTWWSALWFAHVQRPLALVGHAGWSFMGLSAVIIIVVVGIPSLLLAFCLALLRFITLPPSMFMPPRRTPILYVACIA